jgi:hypothetical protein
MGYIKSNYTHNARQQSAILPGRVQGIDHPENHTRTTLENIFSAPDFWGDIFFENFLGSRILKNNFLVRDFSEKNKMINDFILDVCDILRIESPVISNKTDHFESDTMLAQCSPDGSVIYLKECDKLSYDLLFAVSHELRHVWQIRTNKEKYLGDYKPVRLCESVTEYNLQEAEIDANAFAAAIMMDFYDVRPLFEGLPGEVKSRIWDRVEIFFCGKN